MALKLKWNEAHSGANRIFRDENAHSISSYIQHFISLTNQLFLIIIITIAQGILSDSGSLTIADPSPISYSSSPRDIHDF